MTMTFLIAAGLATTLPCLFLSMADHRKRGAER